VGIRDRPKKQPSPGPGFVALRDRAAQFLATARGGLDDAALADALFGTASGGRWAGLLATVLGQDARFVRANARWRLARPAQPGAVADKVAPGIVAPSDGTGAAQAVGSSAIVTLALATTGADPRRHRIARLAVVRRAGGEVTARLDVVLNTGRRLARYLREGAGVADDELDDVPVFCDVVPTLRELVEGGAVHIYGAARASAFIAAELRRAELPALAAQVVELDELAGSLLPGSRKPGLNALADELGVPRAERRSPLAEAELAARLGERLHERRAASPPRAAMAESGQFTDGTGDRVAPLPFTRAWLAGVPEGPGVYLIEDADGRALYVGKAVALRRRLGAYVSRLPSLHRRFEALGVRAAATTTIETVADLDATLLEARLIRERRPPFNVARRTRGPATIIRAAPHERSPRVRLVSVPRWDGASYFGPFESEGTARRALATARAAHPDAFARRLGDVGRQREAVLAVCRLLSGQKGPTLAALGTAMGAAASRGDRGEVDRLRATLRGIQALSIEPSALAGLPAGWRALVLERLATGRACVHLLQDGRRVGAAAVELSQLPDEPQALRQLAEQIQASSAGGGPSDDPDEPAIVLRWLAQSRSRIEVRRVPAEQLAGDEQR
jgi:DNA polymerase-3 subunit epsilon